MTATMENITMYILSTLLHQKTKENNFQKANI